MCDMTCIQFGEKALTVEDIMGKRVLEVGALDVNGSLRHTIESLKPAEYIGVDIVRGYGVDIVCSAEDVLERFGADSFDVVVSTEMLEHVRDWRRVVSNFKGICGRQGVILITTRSHGFAYHGWPYDFWRFEPSDMERIFSDFNIEYLERDSLHPGVFIKARKPADFTEKDLSDIELYSVVTGGRVRELDDATLEKFLIDLPSEFKHSEVKRSFRGRIRVFARDAYWQARLWARGMKPCGMKSRDIRAIK